MKSNTWTGDMIVRLGAAAALVVALASFGAVQPLQSQAAGDTANRVAVADDKLEVVADIWYELDEIRGEWHEQIAAIHAEEPMHGAREAMEQRVAQVFEEHSMDRREYNNLFYYVTTDDATRARFDELVAQVEGRRQARAALAAEEPAEEEEMAAEEEQQSASDPTPELIEEGAQIYSGTGNCVACHGQEGAGTPIGPMLSDSDWLHVDGSYSAIIQIITDGVPNPMEAQVPMAPKGGSSISDQQVQAVAAYVWSLSQ